MTVKDFIKELKKASLKSEIKVVVLGDEGGEDALLAGMAINTTAEVVKLLVVTEGKLRAVINEVDGEEEDE